MPWIKALHIIFVTAWFAGLFYLPRVFVNLAQETDDAARARLLLMARKLYRFMTLLMVPALGFGLWLWFAWWWSAGGAWLHAKLAIVVALVGYHHVCGALLRRFEAGGNTRSHVWYRWFNEVPVLLLAAAVILVVVKPF